MMPKGSDNLILINASSPLSDFEQIAELHCSQINHGLIQLLGKKFVAELYRSISSTPSSRVLVLKHGETVLGFLAGSLSLKDTFRSVIRDPKLVFIFVAQFSFLNPRILKKLPSMLYYSFRRNRPETSEFEDSYPELLSIAVKPDQQGSGIGKKLILKFEEFLKQSNCEEYIVSTNIEDMKSNEFYQKRGFSRFRTTRHHALILQIYIKKLSNKDSN